MLAGPSGSGKSHWAAAHFPPEQVVASDAIRALVGEGPHDQKAGTDAFLVLDLVVERRLRRGLLTVVDTLGLEPERRARWVETARRYGRPVIAVLFDTPAAECRRRNKARPRPVPASVVSAQLARWPASRDAVATEDFDAVHPPGVPHLVPAALAVHATAAARQKENPVTLRFGLQIPSFTWPGGDAEIATHLARIAADAEAAGFTSLWVMDHFIQIPFAGREWEPMLESYTTLAFLAGQTATARLGAMVTGVTYRNVAHLGKIIATLDVLSRGRAVCGLGAAWSEREHQAYGWRFPPVAERFELLEDALQVLPQLWGPGAPAFQGKQVTVPEALSYPRPLQETIPILVGGSGERRTLRLVAQYADACNLFGEPDVVRHKVSVLQEHCAALGRDPAEITITQLGTVLLAKDAAALETRIDELVSERRVTDVTAFRERVNAGTIDEHIGRFRAFAEAGVQEAILSMPDVHHPDAIPRFAEIVEAFA